MHIVRVFRSGVVALAGLGCFGLAFLPGCDDTPPSGGQVKVDPNEASTRQKKIEEMYKANPLSKGPGGQLPPNAAKK